MIVDAGVYNAAGLLRRGIHARVLAPRGLFGSKRSAERHLALLGALLEGDDMEATA